METGEVVQWAKALAMKPGNVSLILRIYMVEGKLPLYLYIHTVACSYMCTHIWVTHTHKQMVF